MKITYLLKSIQINNFVKIGQNKGQFQFIGSIGK
jgi:hypothetical protein